MRVNSMSLVSQYESESKTNLRLTVDSYFMPFSGYENVIQTYVGVSFGSETVPSDIQRCNFIRFQRNGYLDFRCCSTVHFDKLSKFFDQQMHTLLT
jgi:hypothetical protein